jgi:hypothetical protein
MQLSVIYEVSYEREMLIHFKYFVEYLWLYIKVT